MSSAMQLFAQIPKRENCQSGDKSDSCVSLLPKVSANQEALQNGLAILFGAMAAIAIVVIIIAGINFMIGASEANTEKILKARRGIIYALVGLIVAISAEVIVFFVIGRL